MSGHTPGTWIVARPNDYGDSSVNVRTADGQFIAEVGDQSRPHVHEDARLIAAAPDLLDALARIVAQDDHHGQLNDSERNQADIAIAKAIGGAS